MTNPILEDLTKEQLIIILEAICSEMVLKLDTDNDPEHGQRVVFASHPIIGTFNVLGL